MIILESFMLRVTIL